MKIRPEPIPEARDFVFVFLKEYATSLSTYVWYIGWMGYYGACFYLFEKVSESSAMFLIEHLVFFSVVILLALPTWLLTIEARIAERKYQICSPPVLSEEGLSISLEGVCHTWEWSALKSTELRECFRFEDPVGERLYIFKKELSNTEMDHLRG